MITGVIPETVSFFFFFFFVRKGLERTVWNGSCRGCGHGSVGAVSAALSRLCLAGPDPSVAEAEISEVSGRWHLSPCRVHLQIPKSLLFSLWGWGNRAVGDWEEMPNAWLRFPTSSPVLHPLGQAACPCCRLFPNHVHQLRGVKPQGLEDPCATCSSSKISICIFFFFFLLTETLYQQMALANFCVLSETQPCMSFLALLSNK